MFVLCYLMFIYNSWMILNIYLFVFWCSCTCRIGLLCDLGIVVVVHVKWINTILETHHTMSWWNWISFVGLFLMIKGIYVLILLLLFLINMFDLLILGCSCSRKQWRGYASIGILTYFMMKFKHMMIWLWCLGYHLHISIIWIT